LVRIWVSTLRVRVVMPADFVAHRACALAFFHGQQMALLGGRRLVRGATVLVSRSRDGDLQAGVMTALGFRVVRGSSSRGGARALAELVRSLRRDQTIALAVDGPRGPKHVAKPGVAVASLAAGAPLHAVASVARRVLTLSGTWDGFEIPLPFTKVAVVVGDAVAADRARSDAATISSAIFACRVRAESVVGAREAHALRHANAGRPPEIPSDLPTFL
jgi:lysophospholipid acyltransferase (LPLAT)-like uncharacterized protein